MKISKSIFAIAIALIFTITSCRNTKSNDDHGHEHNADGSHMEAAVEQEEFQVEKEATEIKGATHKHEGGAEHGDH